MDRDRYRIYNANRLRLASNHVKTGLTVLTCMDFRKDSTFV